METPSSPQTYIQSLDFFFFFLTTSAWPPGGGRFIGDPQVGACDVKGAAQTLGIGSYSCCRE